MEKQVGTFTWIIKNFSKYPNSIKSSVFGWDISPNDKWFVKLKPEGNTIEVRLCEYYHHKYFLVISYILEVLNCNYDVIFRIRKTNRFQNHLQRELLLRSLINDILVLEFSILEEWETNQEGYVLPPLPYKNGLFTDVVLRARDAEFRVHKAILWARWPKMAEKLDAEGTSEVVLDIEPNVLEAIIKYVYTAKVDFSGNEFQAQVSDAAKKYELPRLIYTPKVAQICRTHISEYKVSFEWPIKNFSSLPINTVLHRYVFIEKNVNCDSNNENYVEPCKWRLIFHVSEDTVLGRIFDISVCKENGWKSVFVRSRISIDRSSFSKNEHVFEKKEIWKCAEFSGIFSTDPKDVLNLKCEFTFSEYKHLYDYYDSGSTESSYDSATSVNCRHLRRDMANLYRSKTLADIDIVVGRETFRAHKFILSARSSVFSRMFESDITESKCSSIPIYYVDPHIMDCMLEFLYAEYTSVYCSDDFQKLLRVAQKYDIPVLLRNCLRMIRDFEDVSCVPTP